MNVNIWISLCLDPWEGASDLKVATWFQWLFLHLGIKQHPNPCVCIFLLQLGSTDSCKARRGVWERGFLVTQGKRNKGMSLGLPNSWLNFRALRLFWGLSTHSRKSTFSSACLYFCTVLPTPQVSCSMQQDQDLSPHLSKKTMCL